MDKYNRRQIFGKYFLSFWKYLLLLCIAIIFAACSNKQDNPNEITFWHFQSEPKHKAALKKIIEKFEKENKCKVNLVELSWSDGKTKLIAAFNSRIPPDVLELGSDWVAQFSAGGVLMDITKDTDINRFVKSSQSPCLWQNKTYALPWYVDTRVVFVNKTILKNAGITDSIRTWQDIQKYSAIVNKGGIYGCGVNGADPHRLYKKVMPMMWSNNADIIQGNRSVINTQNSVEALNTYLELAQTGIIESQKNLDNLFLQGRIAFLYSGGWLLDKLKKGKNNFEYDIIQVPDFNQNQGISFIGGEYISVSATCKKRDLAVKFLKFITSGEATLEYCKNEIGTVLPADKEYFNHSYFYSKPYMSVFINQIQNAKMTTVHPKWLEIEEIIESSVEKALYKKATSAEVLKEADTEINKLIGNN